jgi:hypothetical protein
MRTRDVLPIADDFDPGDIKGWALGWFFPIAEVLTAAGDPVPEHWGFHDSPLHAGMSLDDYATAYANDPENGDWATSEVVAAYSRSGVAGLLYVGNVLTRYLDLFVRGTERDY